MSLKTIGSIVLGVVVIATGAIFVYANNNPQGVSQPSSQDSESVTDTTSGQSTTASSSATGGSSRASSYTLADVAAHPNGSSCWSAINGKVYDLTSWINQHPGGPQRILAICGKDGSAAFNDQHGGEARPADELTQFYIGTLAQ